MVDIHSHMLPGVDDGARNMEEALIMADMAVQSGVTAMAVTPHSNERGGFVNYESQYLRECFLELQYVLQEEGIPLKIYRGMEVSASFDLADKLHDNKIITLNDSGYLLVEFLFDEEPWMMEAVVKDVLASGRIPVIAHPERYACVQEKPDMVEKLLERGALFQMNKGSILGRFGSREAFTADKLLHKNAYACIASDAHRPHMRTTRMAEVKSYISRKFSELQADILLCRNPMNILENKEIHRIV